MHRARFSGVGPCLLAGLLGWVAWGCKEALNPTGPARRGPDTMPPSLDFSPSKDTVVDSIGVLLVAVSAHDENRIDSIALLTQGVRTAFQAAYPQDTTALVAWPVSLVSLQHQPFSFQVVAGDILGHEITTRSVTVTPR